MDFASLIKQIASVQSTMQAATVHAVNVSLTLRNWLIGYYIVEFEQHGEDRAKYGEKLLQNLEKKLNIRGMTERRFRECRLIYTVYPQMGEEITNFLPAETISRLSLAESNLPIRRTLSGEFKGVDNYYKSHNEEITQ
jgi:hypothetical protein